MINNIEDPGCVPFDDGVCDECDINDACGADGIWYQNECYRASLCVDVGYSCPRLVVFVSLSLSLSLSPSSLTHTIRLDRRRLEEDERRRVKACL